MKNMLEESRKTENILNDSRTKLLLIAVTVPFTALTAAAVWQNGFLGIFEYQFKNFGGVQVLIDLIIALSFFIVWMWNDAKNGKRNPWPWIMLTLVAGSFGPLFYLISRKPDQTFMKEKNNE